MFNICYGINIRKQWRVLQRRKEKNNVSREQYNDAVTSVSFWQLFCNFKLSWIYHISVFKIQIGPIKDFSTLENLGIISIPIPISTSIASSIYINMYPPKYIWNSYRNETSEITKMYFFRDKHFINKCVGCTPKIPHNHSYFLIWKNHNVLFYWNYILILCPNILYKSLIQMAFIIWENQIHLKWKL